MNMRQHRHARIDLQRQYVDGCKAEQTAQDDGWWDESDHEPRDATCQHCAGTGGDPWNDGITPCEFCDGEGYEWWN